MTTIVSLHDLAQRELTILANTRWMPNGWDRTGQRKADRNFYVLNKALAVVLLSTPDCLLVYPSNTRIKMLCREAAQQRLVTDMVAKMVQLLAAEPPVDQENANALCELADLLRAADRLESKLRMFKDDITKELGMFALLGLTELPELLQGLNRLLLQAGDKKEELTASEVSTACSS